VTVPAGEVKAQELTLAKQLIDQLVNEEFEPQKYHDTVRERVLEAIQRKVEGQDITSDVQPDASGKILDLMEALKASLARTQSDEKEDARAAS
jgi:DNA end-binding protein Ku